MRREPVHSPMSHGDPDIKVEETSTSEGDGEIKQLLPLFQLLMRNPAAQHDFGACPVCKRYGITSLEPSA